MSDKKRQEQYFVLKNQEGFSESQIAKLGRQDIIIPKHKMVKVVCGKLKNILREQYAILEPNEDTPWSTALDKTIVGTVTQ